VTVTDRPHTTAAGLRAFWAALWPVLVVAVGTRALLVASGSVSFHSDEAVVALMARHILQGDRPVFFYGQAYMGSLDAWAVALGFAALGEGVPAIRIVQSVLALVGVVLGCAVAWQMTRPGARVFAVRAAGVLLAVPPVLVALYTTATLGGYNQTLILGTACLLCAFGLPGARGQSAWARWVGLGFAAGVGWWTNNLIAAYLLAIAVYLLVGLVREVRAHRRVPVAAVGGAAAAAVAFITGGWPWWAFNLAEGFPSLAFLTGTSGPSALAGTDTITLPLAERVLGTVFLGLPTLIGARWPWAAGWFAPPLSAAVLGIVVFLVWRAARAGERVAWPGARGLLFGMIGGFTLVFLISRFSADPTGRYFLPLYMPLAVLIAWGAAALRPVPAPSVGDEAPASGRTRLQAQGVGAVLVGLLAAFMAFGQFAAAREEPGLTTQFNLQTHIPNTHDAALIAFLDRNGLAHGYTNYWIAFRLAFLSQERLIYRAVLPYKIDLTYTPRDERYAPYTAAVDDAAAAGLPLAYITANVPEVERLLEARFAAEGAACQRETVGPYTVYHACTPVQPGPPFAPGL
jgi:hypothetical protein